MEDGKIIMVLFSCNSIDTVIVDCFFTYAISWAPASRLIFLVHRYWYEIVHFIKMGFRR